MFWNAKNRTISFDNTEMNYVSFGCSDKKLILLPGLSDVLTTVRGKAFLLAIYYSLFLKKYRVYMFSRKNDITENCLKKWSKENLYVWKLFIELVKNYM